METHIKYPRTPHLPWSLTVSRDDDKLTDIQHFRGLQIVATEKMDGENTTMYRDGLHARSLNSRSSASQSWVRSLHAKIQHQIPQEWRICGENVFAKHSMAYNDLESYFFVFSIWDKDRCLSWPETVVMCQDLGLVTVPVLYSGTFDIPTLKQLADKSFWSQREGYVVRLASSFRFDDFSTSIAKFVRPNHVQTEEHWKNQQLVKNHLRKENRMLVKI